MFRLKREAILPALENRARRLLAERPEVLEVRLFGSLIKGNAGPGSDADILIVLSESEKSFLDRIADYARLFSGIGVGCDIFPYTRAELASLLDDKSHFATCALRESRVLAVRPPRASGAGAR